jgi:translation initiation factor 5B
MTTDNKTNKIRQPIITVAGHVDHGKTSILDCFRESCIQEGEAGGITQKISFTKYPIEQVKATCPLINQHGVKIELPGFLFIDTPGHAAFTNLRKRGGSLADLAILVVSIKEGIKPQTAEVLQILKANKTPFLIALNKIDTISGWQTQKDKPLKKSIESQAINVSQEFTEALLTFQGSLSQYGFDSDIYFDVKDFTKKIAIVPCSAKTNEGIPELLLTICGLSQRFLKERIKISKDAKGVILEVKKERSIPCIEAILYDGTLKANDNIAIATMEGAIETKVRAIEEIEPLCFSYVNTKEATAATGIRLHLTTKENILPGMSFQKINNNLKEIKESFKKEISKSLKPDKHGIIIKADSLGSLEALITLLRQEKIPIVKAGIGDITKSDIISAKANLEINPLDAVIIGFNVKLCEDVSQDNIKVITDRVVYKLIENIKEWRKNKQTEIERERLLSLATICKAEILHQHVFRNSNPAVFGVHIHAGKLKKGMKLIDENGNEVARVKAMQHEKESVDEAEEDQELAISLPGVNFERKLKETKYLYSEISEKQFKTFKKNKDLLSRNELQTLQEIQVIKQKDKDSWGL